MSGDFNSCVFIPAHPKNFHVGRVAAVDVIVIHVTESDSALGSARWFAEDHGAEGPSSAHYVIAADGTLYQCVRETDTAFAAPGFNARGIHIEHQGWTNKTVFPRAQMQASAALVDHLCTKYGIPRSRDHIKGHSELPGQSHTDPGSTWPWTTYMDIVVHGVPKTPMWQHKDGIPVKGVPVYGVTWPEGTVMGVITADDKYLVWTGTPVKPVQFRLSTPGKRKLTVTAHDAKHKLLGSDDLYVVAG